MLDEIAEILKLEIDKQLRTPRQSRGYYGELKRGVSAPIASGNLLNSVNVEWVGSFETGDLGLVVKMADYWYYINNGRKPGRMPPIGPIDRWVVQKQGFKDVVRGQDGKFIKRKSLVYLIRRSIGQYGYQGTEFLDKAYANTSAIIIEKFGEALGDWFLSLFDENSISVVGVPKTRRR